MRIIIEHDLLQDNSNNPIMSKPTTPDVDVEEGVVKKDVTVSEQTKKQHQAIPILNASDEDIDLVQKILNVVQCGHCMQCPHTQGVRLNVVREPVHHGASGGASGSRQRSRSRSPRRRGEGGDGRADSEYNRGYRGSKQRGYNNRRGYNNKRGYGPRGKNYYHW